MKPLRFFVPSQTTYQLALHFLKMAERDLHSLKQGKKPNYHNGNFEFENERKKDLEAIPEDMEAFRKGMHFAALAISSQMMDELLHNDSFFQSIGEVELCKEKLRGIPLFDLDRQDANEYAEDVRQRVDNVIGKLQKIPKDLKRHYPYQKMLDIAAHGISQPNEDHVP